MTLSNRRACCNRWLHRDLAVILLLILFLTANLAIGQPNEKPPEPPDRNKAENKTTSVPPKQPQTEATRAKRAGHRAANVVVVQCTDGSTLRLKLLEERIDLNTPYGRLLIPVRDIQRIEFAFRIPEETARRIQIAIADLGNADFERRESASAELLELRQRAYPALVKASKSHDDEVKHRARGLLEKIQGDVSEELLQFRTYDVVYTDKSKNTGHIASATLKVLTSQFGEQQLRLSDVLALRSPSATEPEVANALPDPGTLSSYLGQIGKIHTFRVTGSAGPGNIWGTDVYSLDSMLAMAAVHAGVLKPGQVGTVRVKILGPQAGLAGSTRNGVASQAFGMYPGSFEFVRPRDLSDR
jgi:hypothetical protein